MQLLKHMGDHHIEEQNQTSEEDLIVHKEKGHGEDEEIVEGSNFIFDEKK